MLATTENSILNTFHKLLALLARMILLLSLVVPGAMSLVASSRAEETKPLGSAPPYGGIDLVFLVDQSGSMRYNDPYSQRANAIKWVLQYLGIDNLYARREAIHRVGVVSFGTDATIDLELTPLRALDENSWNALYAELEQKVVPKAMGNTDVLKGLELVKEVFDKAPRRDATRLATRGIIVLTDGAPYREGWQQDPRYAGTNFYTPYFREMNEFIATNLPIARSPRSTEGYHIWVLGLNAREEGGQQAAFGTSWVEQENNWERILNPTLEIDRVRRISSDRNAKIPDDIVRVLDTMMIAGICNDDAGPAEKPNCIVEEQFTVPPYVARANFSIFKPQPTSQIVFFTPDNQLLDRSSASVKVQKTGEVIETISVENPAPGRWRWQKLDTSAGQATVVFQSLFGQAGLLEPKSTQDLFDTVTLHIALQDLKGQRMIELPEYPIEVEATVTMPDGKTYVYPLTSQQDGTWKANQGILLDQPGSYKVSLRGLSKDIDGKQVKLFAHWEAEFTAGSLIPALIQPSGNVPLFHQVPIEIRLLKPDGSQPGVSAQHTVRLEAELVMPNGQRTMLTLTQGTTPNSYMADPITVRLPGRHSIALSASMNIGGKVTNLFDKAIDFNVGCIRVDIPSPVGDQPQNGMTDIKVSVTDCSGTPYKEDSTLPWEVVARVSGPSAERQVPLPRISDGVYRGQFSPDLPGTWQIVATAQLTTPAGDRLIAFDGVTRQIEVYPTTLVRLNLLSPKPNERQRIRSMPRIPPIPETTVGRPRPMQISAEVLDLNDRPVPADRLGASPEKIVQATLYGPKDLATGRVVTLTVASGNPSQFVAEVPGLRETGVYTLSLAFDSLHREYLPESQQPVKIVFERDDPFRFVTTGVLAAEAILLALLAFWLVRFFVVRINPVKGTLEFEVIGVGSRENLGAIVLGSYGKNTFIIDSKTLSRLDSRITDVVGKLKIKNATTRRPGDTAKPEPEVNNDADRKIWAIKIWGWGPDNQMFVDGQEYSENMPELLVGDIYVRYHHD